MPCAHGDSLYAQVGSSKIGRRVDAPAPWTCTDSAVQVVHDAGGLQEQKWTDLDVHEASGFLLLNRDLHVNQ